MTKSRDSLATMGESMRERVCRAACCPSGCIVADEPLTCPATLICATEVDAVLAALVEPTEAMIEAAKKASYVYFSEAELRTRYRAMIGAIR